MSKTTDVKVILERIKAAVHGVSTRMAFAAEVIMRPHLTFGTRHQHIFEVECVGPDGKVKWTDTAHNIVVNVGLSDILQCYYTGESTVDPTGTSPAQANQFVGLIDDSPTVAAADTMATQAGWTEAVPYSESVRQEIDWGSESSQSCSNTASKASFSINAGDTVGGAFLCDDNTKSGSSGTLIGAAVFSGGDKVVADGDTLNVTVTATASSS